jgi:RNA polymerase sigma-70 factor, ECF subfamily
MVKAIRSLMLSRRKGTDLEPPSISPTDRAPEFPISTTTNRRLTAIGLKPIRVAASQSAKDCSPAAFVDALSDSSLLKGQTSGKWVDLVARIKAREDAGMEELYRVFSTGIRFYFHRQLGGGDLDDKIHDTFLIVVKAIQNSALREPDRLMGYVRTVARRQVAAAIAKAIDTRWHHTDLEHCLIIPDLKDNPEDEAIITEEARLVDIALESLSPKDREILVRFYLKEESQVQICKEMSLTDTQFRLSKSRAKAKLGALGRKNCVPVNTDSRIVISRAN